ncbi:MAG: hypothetical protein V4704_01920 [Pseudomonadota bacterium]
MTAKRITNWRPSWGVATLGVAIGVVIASSLALAPSAVQAVHSAPYPFELDGDATKTTLLGEWNDVFNLPQDGNPLVYPSPRGTPDAGPGETFVVDGPNLAGGKETSAWSGSNKDIDTIDTWEYKSAKVVPDKDNITNAYAKAYSVDHDGDGSDAAGDTPNHLTIYFGADRFANNGDAALGFWFFRNDVGLGPNGQFTGEHAVGDILVQVDFVGGGSSSEVQIFKWVGSGGSHGALDQLEFAAANGSTVCTPDDYACATTNNTATPSPWAYTPKSGASNIFPSESFFEAGIDITALVGEVCFSSFMAETRSSHSETAELKDFALGDFDLCSVDVEKVCVIDDGFPTVDPANETFTTRHDVTITNTGFGAIYDVELRDDNVDIAAGKLCTISGIIGGVGGPTVGSGIDFTSNTHFIEVANRLDPGAANAMTVELLCTTGENPFRNAVSVQSKATPTSASSDVDDTDTETQAQADVCGLTLSTGLAIQKWCQGDPGAAGDLNPAYAARAAASLPNRSVFLNPANSYKPDVCVDIRLSNTTADQRMEILSFDDPDLDITAGGNLLSQIPLDSKGRRTLAPMGQTGDSIVVSDCYSPAAPDGGQTDPGLAAFSDTVTSHARGTITPNIFPTQTSAPGTEKILDTATCKLCPTCPDCGS